MPRILFIGKGRSAVCHYRCRLPAEALGADWCGVSEEFVWETGNTGGPPDIDSYDVLVCQQPAGALWERRLRQQGAKGQHLVYETDDYLHGVRHQMDHAFQHHFPTGLMKEYDRAMAMCDEVIVSTKFLAERYSRINPHITICRNGLDVERYDYERPPREHITVGWAGGTGHTLAVQSWLDAGVIDVLRDFPNVQLLAVGETGILGSVAERLGEDRVLGVPWGPLETYPAAMAGADIYLAPTGPSKWYRGKSDLRWMEASALGAPCICGPYIYPDAEYVAARPEDAGDILRGFLEEPDRIAAAGSRARQRVLDERSFPAAVAPWRRVLA